MRLNRRLRGLFALGLMIALAAPNARAAHAASALTVRARALDLRAADGLDAAAVAARGWEPDVVPVHVETADSLHDDGSAAAWAYVFWSPAARLARAYTVRHDGTLAVVDLAFPFDPPPAESGWLDATDALARLRTDPRLGRAPAGRLVSAALSRGLVEASALTRDALPRTAWLFTFTDGAGQGEDIVLDALRGVVLERHAASAAEPAQSPAGTVAGGRRDLPPWLAAHATLVLSRLGALHERGVGANRARWLTGRESASLARLSAQDATLDSLGHGTFDAAGGDLDQRLAALAQWKATSAAVDSQLARSSARIDACLRDLASETPTAVAVYLGVTDHARPARVSVLVDGVEAARATYGDAEWRALDAGAWAELARLSVRPGARTIQIDVEGADHRIDHATWHGEVARGRWSLLRLSVSGERAAAPGAGPRLDLLSATAP